MSHIGENAAAVREILQTEFPISPLSLKLFNFNCDSFKKEC